MSDEKHEVSLGTLYDLNKQIMLTQPRLTKKELKEASALLEKWFKDRITDYAMLLCREKYDFTIIKLYTNPVYNSPNLAAINVLDCLYNRCYEILSIEKQEFNDNCWEIWVRKDNETLAYYLFDCSDFVIHC